MREFSCLSCHDAHDNGNYRNLKLEINGYPTPVHAIGDPNYQDNMYISGMNQFCGACHEAFHGDGNTRGVRAWKRHPVGITISDAPHADFQKWSSTKNKITLVENPSGDPNNLYSTRVFCLSCHYAHAGSYKDALRWDYSQSTQGCLECHTP